MHISKIRMLGIAVLLMAAGPVYPEGASAETTLRVAVANDLKILDPITNTGYESRNHGYMIYDTLFAVDEHLQPQPQMVDTWTVSDDKLTYTFNLRDGLLWHDDTPVTAEDCVASIRRWGARDTMGQRLMEFTADLKASDDKTFTLTLKEPYGLVLQSLAKISSNVPFMMPKKVAETDPSQAITTTIGSGPFKFVTEEWVPGSKVVYVKNAKYVPRQEPADMAAGGKVVNVDRVEWIYFSDPATAANALIAGEVDYVPEPAFDLLPLLKESPDVTVEMLDPLGWQGMVRINHLAPPFDNAKMRQAMLSVVDQKEYLQAAIGNPEYYRTCVAFFVCGSPSESAVGGEQLEHPDLERAKKLFEEAGYKGEPIVILQPTDEPVLAAVSLVTAQRLRQIGVNVDLQAMDWSTLASRRQSKEPIEKGGWNIFHTLFNATDVLDPVVNIGANSGCDQAWFGWPCDEKVEKLRDQFSRETDASKRKTIIDEMQTLLYQDVAYIPFGQYSQPVAYRSNIKGVIKAGPPFVWNLTKN